MVEGGPAAAVNGLTVGTPDLDPVFFGMWTPSTEALPPNSQVSTRADQVHLCYGNWSTNEYNEVQTVRHGFGEDVYQSWSLS